MHTRRALQDRTCQIKPLSAPAAHRTVQRDTQQRTTIHGLCDGLKGRHHSTAHYAAVEHETAKEHNTSENCSTEQAISQAMNVAATDYSMLAKNTAQNMTIYGFMRGLEKSLEMIDQGMTKHKQITI